MVDLRDGRDRATFDELVGLVESFHFAQSHGLDLQVFRDVLYSGPMASAVSSIGQYVAAYAPAADEIAAMTRQTRAALGPDTVRSLREIGERVWQAVAGYDQDGFSADPSRAADYARSVQARTPVSCATPLFTLAQRVCMSG